MVNDSSEDLELGLVDQDLVELQRIRKKALKVQKFQRRRLTSSHLVEQDNSSKQLEKMGEFAAWFCIAFVIIVCLLAEIELSVMK